jgi:maltooligosyltrehalose trehalohydrolase
MVRKGRAEEFKAFGWEEEPPDPTAESTFLASKLHWELAGEGNHRALIGLYRELIRLRRTLPYPAARTRDEIDVWSEGDVILLRRRLMSQRGAEILAAFNVGDAPYALAVPPGPWELRIDSSDQRWNGPGREAPASLPDPGAGEDAASLEVQPRSFVLLTTSRSA